MDNKVHYYWLDALRFVAAFMVLLSHSRNTFFPAYGELPVEQHSAVAMAFWMFCRMGHEAVVIFFVLSGFLVGGRGIERIKFRTMDVGSYVIDRVSRIYPPPIDGSLFPVRYQLGNTRYSIFLENSRRQSAQFAGYNL